MSSAMTAPAEFPAIWSVYVTTGELRRREKCFLEEPRAKAWASDFNDLTGGTDTFAEVVRESLPAPAECDRETLWIGNREGHNNLHSEISVGAAS